MMIGVFTALCLLPEKPPYSAWVRSTKRNKKGKFSLSKLKPVTVEEVVELFESEHSIYLIRRPNAGHFIRVRHVYVKPEARKVRKFLVSEGL